MPAFHPTEGGQSQRSQKTSAPALLEQAGLAYTCLPDYFLDHIAPTLTPTELRVMVYIYRRTLGHNKLTDSISYDQFIQGITTRDGRKLDQGAGVSRRALVTALAALEERGLISRHHLRPDPTSFPQPALIRINLRFSTENVDNSVESMVEDCPSASQPGAKFAPQPPPQVQNFPAEGQNEVQKSGPTIESHESQKTDRVCDPAEVNFLSEKISGLSKKDARKLVEIAQSNGRDKDYLIRLVAHVLSQPNVRVPAALLTSLVKQDADRLPTSHNNGDIWISPHQRVRRKSAIDFSKYGGGGKYSFLEAARSGPADG